MKPPKAIQISIPQPCSEDWNKMTPQERGRFCDSCQKCVVDFTNFSDTELYQYLLENAGKKACGRFRATQLNRPIQIPHQPHSQLYKWIIAAGLTLVFAGAPAMQTFARAPFFEITQNDYTPVPDEKNKANKDTLVVRGYVTDENNEPVYSAQVAIRNGQKALAGTVSDTNGYFEIKLSTTDTANANIFVHYIGLREYKAPLPANGGTMNITLESTDATFGLIEFIILEHDPPLINKFEGGHSRTIKSNEIEKGAY